MILQANFERNNGKLFADIVFQFTETKLVSFSVLCNECSLDAKIVENEIKMYLISKSKGEYKLKSKALLKNVINKMMIERWENEYLGTLKEVYNEAKEAGGRIELKTFELVEFRFMIDDLLDSIRINYRFNLIDDMLNIILNSVELRVNIADKIIAIAK